MMRTLHRSLILGGRSTINTERIDNRHRGDRRSTFLKLLRVCSSVAPQNSDKSTKTLSKHSSYSIACNNSQCCTLTISDNCQTENRVKWYYSS